jgi:hypothetical protein
MDVVVEPRGGLLRRRRRQAHLSILAIASPQRHASDDPRVVETRSTSQRVRRRPTRRLGARRHGKDDLPPRPRCAACVVQPSCATATHQAAGPSTRHRQENAGTDYRAGAEGAAGTDRRARRAARATGAADRSALRTAAGHRKCLADDDFQIIQSRPITTLFRFRELATPGTTSTSLSAIASGSTPTTYMPRVDWRCQCTAHMTLGLAAG